MFSPCSLLVVGWLQPLFLKIQTVLTQKTIKNTVSHSNKHCKLKTDPSYSQRAMILLWSVKATTLLIVTSLVQHMITPVVFPKHHLLVHGLHTAWAQPRQSRSKDSKMYLRWMTHFLTEAPHCFEPNVRFNRSVVVPVPSQLTTQ